MRLLTVSLLLALGAIADKDGKACADQFQDAIEVNIRLECHELLAPIVAAIRYAENGGPGREYGILHPRVKPTYRSQAGWCAATVQKTYDRWVKAGRGSDFITYLDNDPQGLNRHWVGNVTRFTKQFQGRTMDAEELGEELVEHVERETRDLDDAAYVECLETIISTLQTSVDCKKVEME